LETPLLRLARQKSIPIVTGIEMFVQQGARQFEIFTGKPAPEEEMLRVVIHSLKQQAEAAAAEAPEPAAKAPAGKKAPAAKAKKAS
jgi:3-dehydroquinate dehydratase/shikimate dehydrogenase